MQRNNVDLRVPVLFLVFNRLDTTKKVFEEIRKAKPTMLFIASDGPREDNMGEKEIVESVRKYVLENIDWKCKVKTLFREKNLGCKYAVSSAIDWFFKNIEMGIILEDDCLPSQSFFRFCQVMLEKYKNDKRIMHISGTNIEGASNVQANYFLSNCFNVWGWATWRRAWDKYDVKMEKWKNVRFSKKVLKIIQGQGLLNVIKSWRLYQLTYSGDIDTWDYQWDFCCLLNNSFCVVPKHNLISNLGFSRGTHTTNYLYGRKLVRKEIKPSARYQNMEIFNKEYAARYIKFFSRSFSENLKNKLSMFPL
jgi:hypothetical protein